GPAETPAPHRVVRTAPKARGLLALRGGGRSRHLQSRTGAHLMPGAHTALAFEDAIEQHLVAEGGWLRGDPRAFDRKLALTPADLFAFLEGSQPETWAAMQK